MDTTQDGSPWVEPLGQRPDPHPEGWGRGPGEKSPVQRSLSKREGEHGTPTT